MTKIMSLLIIGVMLPGCAHHVSVTKSPVTTPEFTLGTQCYIGHCEECRGVAQCPLSTQDIVGASCSCNTPGGIKYGVVGR